MGKLPSEGFLQIEEKSKIESEGDVTMEEKNGMLALEMEEDQGVWAASLT